LSLTLEHLARPFVVFVERFYPDAFVFAILLTGVSFGLAVGLTDTGPVEALGIWGRGLTGSSRRSPSPSCARTPWPTPTRSAAAFTRWRACPEVPARPTRWSPSSRGWGA
jgi:hypothetical protein